MMQLGTLSLRLSTAASLSRGGSGGGNGAITTPEKLFAGERASGFSDLIAPQAGG